MYKNDYFNYLIDRYIDVLKYGWDYVRGPYYDITISIMYQLYCKNFNWSATS